MQDKKMSLVQHLMDLRKTILTCLFAWMGGTFLSFIFVEDIIDLLKKPSPYKELVFLSPTEPFYIFLKVSLLAGAIIASPVIVYSTGWFLNPALTSVEKRTLIAFSLITLPLFGLGVAFGYFFIMPRGLAFLSHFGAGLMEANISLGEYVPFALFFLFAFGLTFQLPLILLTMFRLGLISLRVLKRGRKFIVVFLVTLAAILTPTPDVFTQLAMALPLYAMYEITLIIASLWEKHLTTKKGRVCQVEVRRV